MTNRPDEPSEFAALIAAVQAGSDTAATELYERFGPQLNRLLRAYVPDQVRSRFDTADFLQSAWKSFFADCGDLEFTSPKSLVNYLMSVARGKVYDRLREGTTLRQGGCRDFSLDSPLAPEIPADDPSPSQAFAADELWGKLRTQQPPKVVEMLELLRAGHTHAEVAERVGVSERTVRRAVRTVLAEVSP